MERSVLYSKNSPRSAERPPPAGTITQLEFEGELPPFIQQSQVYVGPGFELEAMLIGMLLLPSTLTCVGA
jgi:hypothetical protein